MNIQDCDFIAVHFGLCTWVNVQWCEDVATLLRVCSTPVSKITLWKDGEPTVITKEQFEAEYDRLVNAFYNRKKEAA